MPLPRGGGNHPVVQEKALCSQISSGGRHNLSNVTSGPHQVRAVIPRDACDAWALSRCTPGSLQPSQQVPQHCPEGAAGMLLGRSERCSANMTLSSAGTSPWSCWDFSAEASRAVITGAGGYRAFSFPPPVPSKLTAIAAQRQRGFLLKYIATAAPQFHYGFSLRGRESSNPPVQL